MIDWIFTKNVRYKDYRFKDIVSLEIVFIIEGPDIFVNLPTRRLHGTLYITPLLSPFSAVLLALTLTVAKKNWLLLYYFAKKKLN